MADGATTYLRIAALGAPAFMLASAGQGYLRGIGDLRTPLLILVAAHAVNVVLEVLFVYGFGWGLAGSAWGTVIAQLGMGAAFVVVQLRAGWERPVLARMRSLMKIGTEIAVRTTALLGSFLVASAVLARVGAPSLAAHQIAFQLFVFLALVLDARGDRGADHRRADARRRRRRRGARGGRADDRVVRRARRRVRARPARARRRDPARLHVRPRGDRARRARSGGCSRR